MMIDWNSQFDDTKMTGAYDLIFFAGSASEVSIDCTEMRIVRTFVTRSEARLIPEMKVRIIKNTGIYFLATYIVSGYSMSMTARRSDSLEEKRPNWISSIVRVGALE